MGHVQGALWMAQGHHAAGTGDVAAVPRGVLPWVSWLLPILLLPLVPGDKPCRDKASPHRQCPWTSSDDQCCPLMTNDSL